MGYIIAIIIFILLACSCFIFKDFILSYQTISAVCISTCISLLSIFINQYHSKKEKQNEKDNFEKAIVMAVAEELKALYVLYDKIFTDAILKVPANDYMVTTFTITQDFFSIYHKNASNIGKISKSEVRKGIVQVYMSLKKFIENILLYNSSYKSFMNRRNIYFLKI